MGSAGLPTILWLIVVHYSELIMATKARLALTLCGWGIWLKLLHTYSFLPQSVRPSGTCRAAQTAARHRPRTPNSRPRSEAAGRRARPLRTAPN